MGSGAPGHGSAIQGRLQVEADLLDPDVSIFQVLSCRLYRRGDRAGLLRLQSVQRRLPLDDEAHSVETVPGIGDEFVRLAHEVPCQSVDGTEPRYIEAQLMPTHHL